MFNLIFSDYLNVELFNNLCSKYGVSTSIFSRFILDNSFSNEQVEVISNLDFISENEWKSIYDLRAVALTVVTCGIRNDVFMESVLDYLANSPENDIFLESALYMYTTVDELQESLYKLIAFAERKSSFEEFFSTLLIDYKKDEFIIRLKMLRFVEKLQDTPIRPTDNPGIYLKLAEVSNYMIENNSKFDPTDFMRYLCKLFDVYPKINSNLAKLFYHYGIPFDDVLSIAFFFKSVKQKKLNTSEKTKQFLNDVVEYKLRSVNEWTANDKLILDKALNYASVYPTNRIENSSNYNYFFETYGVEYLDVFSVNIFSQESRKQLEIFDFPTKLRIIDNSIINNKGSRLALMFTNTDDWYQSSFMTYDPTRQEVYNLLALSINVASCYEFELCYALTVDSSVLMNKLSFFMKSRDSILKDHILSVKLANSFKFDVLTNVDDFTRTFIIDLIADILFIYRSEDYEKFCIESLKICEDPRFTELEHRAIYTEIQRDLADCISEEDVFSIIALNIDRMSKDELFRLTCKQFGEINPDKFWTNYDNFIEEELHYVE